MTGEQDWRDGYLCCQHVMDLPPPAPTHGLRHSGGVVWCGVCHDAWLKAGCPSDARTVPGFLRAEAAVNEKATITCESCGKNIGMVWMDGYEFGDRLLEGVKFIIVLETHQVIGVRPVDEDYFDDLNREKWLKEAQDYAENHLDIAECPKCGGDVDIPWHDFESYHQTGQAKPLHPLKVADIHPPVLRKSGLTPPFVRKSVLDEPCPLCGDGMAFTITEGDVAPIRYYCKCGYQSKTPTQFLREKNAELAKMMVALRGGGSAVSAFSEQFLEQVGQLHESISWFEKGFQFQKNANGMAECMKCREALQNLRKLVATGVGR